MLGRIELPASQLTALSGCDADKGEIRSLKLRKAARDFEALFVYQLLKTMRSSFASVDKGDTGFGKDIFMSIADQALSDKISDSDQLGIGRLLIGELERNDHSREQGSESNQRGDDPFIPLSRERFKPVEVRSFRPMNRYETRKNGPPDTGLATDVDGLIEVSSKKYNLPAGLIRAVIQVESAGNSNAVSDRGAKGLMQLTDSTAADLGVENVFDPAENVDAGSRYLSSLLKRFSGNLKLALAAYNAGPGAVERHGGVPPYDETVQYVDKVLGFMKEVF